MSDLDARVTVRLARAADAESIAHVQRESWRTSYAGILPLDVIASHAGTSDAIAWKRRVSRQPPDAATWIAERSGRIVGFASCGPARDPVQGLDAEIYALYVLQDEQRRGVGRELVRACAKHFARRGLFGFYLWVLKANRARMFYAALGGEEVGEKVERLGRHDFAEIAYGWSDLTGLIAADE
ncbi:MAG TPA: GNAT family N-acetyltransferase [Usitatibacter sp.]|nr:GNAT family N-acetyltransferase [Usitatibacter sp.]